jgi:hypothetical protein
VLLTATAAPAAAQEVAEAIIFEDFGFTQPLFTSARATALGGAFAASADDVHALMFNPAGLARVKRIELALGIQQERIEVNNEFFGTATGVDKRAGGIEAISLAFPLPTYRGSFVGAFGVYRLYTGHVDLHYRGTNTENDLDYDTEDNYFLQQNGALYSYNLGFGVDLSPTLAGGLTLFIVDGTIDALEQFDYSYHGINQGLTVFVTEDRSIDVDGFGARVGAQFFFHRHLSAGFAFQTPILVRTDGVSFTEETKDFENDIDTFSQAEGVIDNDLVLPFQVDVGAATSFKGLTLSVQFGYADWAEAAIDRKRLRAPTLEPVFREVIELRAGLEWTVPRVPLRLRAGYARRPYPLQFMQGDRIDALNFQKSSTGKEREQVSLGLGALVGSTVTVDAAYVRAEGSRSLPFLVDERVTQRYLLTASYRF